MEDTNNKFTATTKKCASCLVFKEFSEFNKCKRASLGLHNHCRQCQKKYKQKWAEKNKNNILKYTKRPDVIARARILYKEKYHNDEKFRNRVLEKNKIRRKLPSAKAAAKIQRKKWYEIPHNKIAHNLRTRLRHALHGKLSVQSTEKLLGVSFEEFKKYLESKFYSNMTWENYGKHWHIDHIIPCDFFDLTNEEHIKLCFNFRNTQPMLAVENISKNNKITIDNLHEFMTRLKNEVLLLNN